MTSKQPNVYSRRWFEFFHLGIDDEARISRETAFICRLAPLPEFRKVVDVCCGIGRHARALAGQGYSVLGLDRHAAMIARARQLGGGPNYIVADIRDYRPEPDAYDVAIVMGQSFGYFDVRTNRDVLARLTSGVRRGGGVFLDLWNPEFFAAHQGQHELNTHNGTVRETKRVDGDRLFVHLVYPDGEDEQFEWQLFTPAQVKELSRSLNLGVLVACTNFDMTLSPSPANPRIQFVLERWHV
jgi:SAM-dependent methyltransferase